jgi:hypothetical protein
MIDKRSSSGNKLKYGELDPDPDNTSRGNTRLSQVRWPLGEEPYPDVEGTDPDDPTVNVKLEVVEHPDTGPNQRDMLGGGPELEMPCFVCHTPLHAAATMGAKEILEKGGYHFPDDFHFPDDANVTACVCANGHIVQLRTDHIIRLIK